VISLTTAYLKANYPAEFFAASLTSEIDDTDRIIVLLDDARVMGIETVPPDINRCDTEFTVEDGKIFFGLAAVKNVGRAAIGQVVGEREENGPFESLLDFCSRVSSRTVNRRAVESLIQSGALDGLPGHRAQKMRNLGRVMEMASRNSRDAERGQFALFTNDETIVDDKLEPCDEWSSQEQLAFEKNSLGFFLSGHPLDKFKDVVQILSTTTTMSLKSSPNGKHAAIAGLISSVKMTTDRKQNPMAFVTIEDRDGHAEAVLFSDVLSKHKDFVAEDRVLLLEGKASARNGGEAKLLVSSVVPINEDRPPDSTEVHISIDLDQVEESQLDHMQRVLAGRKGTAQVYLHLRERGEQACVVRSKSLAVDIDYDVLAELCGSVGAKNIKLVRGNLRST
jgi:DNA polymerase-3 subunit alpha